MTTSILAGLGILILVSLTIKALLPVSEKEKEQERKAVVWEAYLMEICIQRKLDWKKKVNQKPVKKLYEGTPKYLFYEFKRELTPNFFWDKKRNFGDLEIHKNLRIRNAKRFNPLLSGEFPSVQAGHYRSWHNRFPDRVIIL